MTATDLHLLLTIHLTTKGMDLDMDPKELKTLRKRGFIEINERAVKVTHLGKTYIENVVAFMK